MSDTPLRPIERVVTRLHENGASTAEIANRIGKRPGTVNRIMEMMEMRESPPNLRPQDPDSLRPLERVVLRLRSEGEGYGQIGNRLARSGRQVRNIERFARLKLDG
jgi:DNA-binding CsgD family transcriptional regulator